MTDRNPPAAASLVCNPCFERFSELLHVLTGGHRNRHDDSGLAFVDGSRFRRIGWPHTHLRQFTQCDRRHGRRTTLRSWQRDRHCSQGGSVTHFATDRQGCIDAADNNLSTRSDDVLFDELVDHPLWCQLQSREPRPIEFEMNALFLQAVESDALNTGHGVQAVAHLLERDAHLAHGVTGAVTAIEATATRPKSSSTKGPIVLCGKASFESATLARTRCQIGAKSV